MLYQPLESQKIQTNPTQPDIAKFNTTVTKMLDYLEGEGFCELKKIEGLLLFSLDFVKEKEPIRVIFEESDTGPFSNPSFFENRFENRVDICVKILKGLEPKYLKNQLTAMKECGIDIKLYKQNPVAAITKAIMCSFANRVDLCIQILKKLKSIDNEIKQEVLNENGVDLQGKSSSSSRKSSFASTGA